MFLRLKICFLLMLTSALTSVAHAGPVTYTLQGHTAQNYSASWLHGADHCNLQGLCMSGDFRHALSGSITGSLDGDVLSVTGGNLTAGSYGLGIHGGSLGGSGQWWLSTTLGDFWFVDLSDYGYSGPDQPNWFDGNQMVLWGQNDAAYGDDNAQHLDALGLDIYAVAVPEPSSIALLLVGIFAILRVRKPHDDAALT